MNNNMNNNNNNNIEDSDEDDDDRDAQCWNDVWNAFINPNLERFPFGEQLCGCDEENGFYVAHNIIYCVSCESKIAPYKICPHTKTEEFFEYNDNQDNDYIIKKCHLCEKILEHNDEFLYYLRIACTHDFKHVGELHDDGKSYCFQCETHL